MTQTQTETRLNPRMEAAGAPASGRSGSIRRHFGAGSHDAAGRVG
jgi:hypothetical protein